MNDSLNTLAADAVARAGHPFSNIGADAVARMNDSLNTLAADAVARMDTELSGSTPRVKDDVADESATEPCTDQTENDDESPLPPQDS